MVFFPVDIDYKNYDPANMQVYKFSQNKFPFDSWEVVADDNASFKDKVTFIDRYMTYAEPDAGKRKTISELIDMMDSIKILKDVSKRDKHGYLYTQTIKSWLSRNDPKGYFDNVWHYGNIEFLAFMPYNPFYSDIGEHELAEMVGKAFRTALSRACTLEEQEYRNNSTYWQKFNRIRKMQEEYGTCFDSQFICDIMNGEDYATEEELDVVLGMYEELDRTANAIKARAPAVTPHVKGHVYHTI